MDQSDALTTRYTDGWMGDKDEADLFELERVITYGLRTFVEVGNALAEIRDRRLYRAEHKTFEDYCRDRWGFVQQHATRLIRAAEVIQNIESEPRGSLLPTTEKHARPLTRLEPAEQIAAWREAVETAPNGKVTAAHVEQVVKRRIEPPPPAADPPAPTPRPEPAPEKMAVHFSSETPEHYTPQAIVDAVVACLGGIDLDPCAHRGHRIPAAKHYTITDDGLSAPWAGKVYMNPPYGRTIDLWVRRLCEEHEKGNVTEAIALVPGRIDTQWWKRMRDYVMCFVEGRLTFIGNDDPAPFPSVLVYLGNDIGKFHDHFSGFGDIWQRLERGMYGE